MENSVSINYNFAKKIFNSLSYENYKKLLFTNESLYSSSKAKGSQKLIDIIFSLCNTYDVVITDGTSNIGTDSIHLANKFKYINCVEIDKDNYFALNNNISILNTKDNMKCYNDDINNIIETLEQDIIYIDAPWGGKNYKEQNNLKLYLGKIEILDFYLKFKDKAKYFIFKLPFNYDFEHLKTYICCKTIIYPYISDSIIKFYFVIIDNT